MSKVSVGALAAGGKWRENVREEVTQDTTGNTKGEIQIL